MITPTAPLTQPGHTQPGHTQPGHTPQSATASQSVPGEHASAFAITGFVLGIASILAGWTFFAPIIGIVFASLALGRNARERTLALWGLWLNIVMLAITALGIMLGIGLAGFGLFTGTFAWF